MKKKVASTDLDLTPIMSSWGEKFYIPSDGAGIYSEEEWNKRSQRFLEEFL